MAARLEEFRDGIISNDTLEQLKKHNIERVDKLLLVGREYILAKTTIDPMVLDRLMETLLQMYAPRCLTADVICLQGHLVDKDALECPVQLGSVCGLSIGEITELIGGPSTGKTWLCHAFAVRAALREWSVFYVDSTASFSTQLLEQDINKTAEIDKHGMAQMINRINVCKVSNAFDLLNSLRQLNRERGGVVGAQMAADRSMQYDNRHQQPALIIVDSMGISLTALQGLEKTTLFHTTMEAIMSELRQLATKKPKTVVLVTNKAQKGYDTISNTLSTPSLGETWSYLAHNRILLVAGDTHRQVKASVLRHWSQAMRPDVTTFEI